MISDKEIVGLIFSIGITILFLAVLALPVVWFWIWVLS